MSILDKRQRIAHAVMTLHECHTVKEEQVNELTTLWMLRESVKGLLVDTYVDDLSDFERNSTASGIH